MFELGPVKRKADKADVTAVIDLGDGATITLWYLDPTDLRGLRASAQDASWDPDTKRFNAFTEAEKMDVLMADAAVIGWTAVAVEGVEVPYTAENARLAMLHSFKFKSLVNNMCSDFSHFITKAKAEEKAEIVKN